MVEIARVDHLDAWRLPLAYAVALLDEAQWQQRSDEDEPTSIWNTVSDEPVRTQSGFEHGPGMSQLVRLMGGARADG